MGERFATTGWAAAHVVLALSTDRVPSRAVDTLKDFSRVFSIL